MTRLVLLVLLVASWSAQAHEWIAIQVGQKEYQYKLICGEKLRAGDLVVPIKDCWREPKSAVEKVVAFEVKRIWTRNRRID